MKESGEVERNTADVIRPNLGNGVSERESAFLAALWGEYRPNLLRRFADESLRSVRPEEVTPRELKY